MSDETAALSDRIEGLEMRSAYQDETVEALNEVVTRQQDQIDRLLADVERLREVIRALSPEGVEPGEEPPPPHY